MLNLRFGLIGADRASLFDMRVAIVASDVGGDAAGALERLRAALSLMRDSDPRRFRRFRDDVHTIVICASRGPAAGFIPRASLCFVDAGFLLKASAGGLAVVLVHEGAHARIDRAGVPPFPDLRSRFERRCIIEELAFMHRLAATGMRVEAAMAHKRRTIAALR
jgi:hypothetical protein